MEVENTNGTTSQSTTDLSSLKKSISLTGVQISMRQCSAFQIKLAPYLLNKPYSPNIIKADENSLDKRIVLLKDTMTKELEGLPEDLKNWIQQEKDNGVEVITHNLEVDYKSYSLEQILTEFLPADVEKTLKVENINDIKILKLTEKQLNHKDFIGKVVLEKSPLTKTVLLQTSFQDTTDVIGQFFFTTKYELLCGEPKTDIEISEGNCKFKVDLLKVPYESSFQAERERLLTIKGKDDLICDVLGDPFYSVRAAKTNQVTILANSNSDENINECFVTNIKLNEVESLVHLNNQDIYTFLQSNLAVSHGEDQPKHISHIYISRLLQDCSFLKLFVGLFTKINNKHYENEDNLPTIHFYLYLSNQEFTDSMKNVISAKLNQIFNESFINKEIKGIVQPHDFETIFFVEDDLAASRKLLHCTVKLSKAIAYCPEALIDQLPKPAVVEAAVAVVPEKTEAKQSKGKKTPTPRKPKSEVVHKTPKQAADLDAEVNAEDDGPRRSSRKKMKSKQYEESDYLLVNSQRESSK